MSIIALTGGIGSGKSEAAKQFAALGVPVVDTDVIAHQLTSVGSLILEEISGLFGKDVLSPLGALDRAKLRAIVFNNAEARSKLEKLLHPAIHREVLALLAQNEHQLKPSYQIVVAPLLFESNQYTHLVSNTIVIDCEEALQIERTIARSKLSEDEVKAIMSAQVTRATRLKLADEIIVNNGSHAELLEKVTKIHKKFIKTCVLSE